jgi:hypothetical protein
MMVAFRPSDMARQELDVKRSLAMRRRGSKRRNALPCCPGDVDLLEENSHSKRPEIRVSRHLRAAGDPGTVTLARDLKSSEF